MVSVLLAIGMEPFSIDDLNSMLNSLMKFMKEHTEKVRVSFFSSAFGV